MRAPRRSLAAALFASVILVPLGAPAPPAMAAIPPVNWQDPECEVDGSPWADSNQCTPPAEVPQPWPALAPSCEGAVFCMATYEQMRQAGFDTTQLEAHEAEMLASMPPHSSPQSPYYSAFVEFDLYAAPTGCSGTVRDNNHCGWLYHRYVIGDDPPTYTSSYPARSGNNNPPNKWTVNVGPLPDTWKSSSPSIASPYRRWGWMNSGFTGYESSGSDTFYPGKWRLDPWNVYSGAGKTGTHRSAFEIHGGRNAHDFWIKRTAGCIRLPSGSITGLKSMWDTRSSNKRDPYVRVRAYLY
jgi:hypothetical protein